MGRKNRKRAEERRGAPDRRRRLQWSAGAALALALLLCGAARIMRSYPASQAALAAMADSRIGNKATVFEAEAPRAGLIFYPGALVQHEAYAPLMQAAALRGVTCLLVEMPLDLAIFDADAAVGLVDSIPQIETWFVGGHSLGGAMAAQCAAENPDLFDALVLLGAYSQKDLSGTDMKVLSVLGSEDGVLSREHYEACRTNYSDSFMEVVIEGGCHAYFGDYGQQKGDGRPFVSRELQIGMTASAIASLVDQ